MRPLCLLALALTTLAGCASNLPAPIREAPKDAPALSEVRRAPQDFIGRQVRWGGTIAGTDNRAEETCFEVVERTLQSNGRPIEEDRSGGRFIACVPGFLDPAIYASGRLLTVSGTIAATETRKVGEYPYSYPVVRVDTHFLWEPEPPAPRYVDDPFWYDPWPGYYPYYPYHPWYGPRPYRWYR